MRETFVVQDCRLFDGTESVGKGSVLVVGERIAAVGTDLDLPAGVSVVEGKGRTLLPGLIDAHAHAKPPALEQALAFGVTTVLDMFSDPSYMVEQRRDASVRSDMADVRTSSVGVTVLGGHPSMMIGTFFDEQFPTVASVEEVPAFIATRIAEGADYIKLFIDDGTALGHASPTLTPELAAAVVTEAHRYGKLAVAHVTSLDGARQAIQAGIDGLVHLFMDQPPTHDIIRVIQESGIFVVPTLSTLGSLTGDISGQALAEDPRANELIPRDWQDNLCRCWDLGSPGKLEYSLEATRLLRQAGVPILLGTDSACVGIFGTAHGVSVHGELGLLVQAGLTPVEALRAATSLPAEKFGLTDRGRLAPGLQADMVLVEGDPTTHIEDSLSIEAVWRRGQRLDREAYGARLAAVALADADA